MPFWCRRSTNVRKSSGEPKRGVGREVAGDLVAPRAGERVRHHRQQLDVREAHVARVGRELVGQLEVVQRAVVLERVQPPRAEVDLVDRHRARPAARLASRCASHSLVAPLVRRAVDDRRGLRRHLGGERERVGLQPDLAVLREDLELVVGALADVGQEQLPDAGRAERAHRVQPPVPGVEVADDRDGARARRPDGERRAGDAVELAHVRAELGVELLVAALAGQVQVELAERRRNAYGSRIVNVPARGSRPRARSAAAARRPRPRPRRRRRGGPARARPARRPRDAR